VLIGFVAVAPLAAIQGLPDASAGEWGWTLVAGAGSAAGIAFVYGALRQGQVSIVTPIVAADGAVAAALAIGAGEEIGLLTAIALAVVCLGMGAVMIRPGEAAQVGSSAGAAVLLALGAAGAFGVSLFAGGRVGDDVGPLWLLLVVRTCGVLVLVLPLMLRGGLGDPRPALRYVVFSGIAEVAAFGAFVVGARGGNTAVAAVIASQFAVIAMVLGVRQLGERLEPLQGAGIAAITIGIAVVSAAQA
jgi:drug/metabolite transporter (DMT)-like permease